jgi:mRNA interferase RelE/StbE
LYRITVKRSAERELRRIDRPMIPRILVAIHNLAANPHPVGSRKLVGSKAEYRIRIGNYRVIYAVDEAEQVVDIQRIRHRKDAYP